MATVQEIYNEINRIDNAKSGIAGAIEEKGVEVPAGAKIEEYPELVRQIQQGDTSDCVKFTPQTLTEEQKAQARENIGAASAGDIPWRRTIEPDPEEDFPFIYIEINGGCILAFDSVGDNSFHGVLNIDDVMGITAASFVGGGGIDTNVDVKIGYDDSDPVRVFVGIGYTYDQPVVITCLAGTAPTFAGLSAVNPVLDETDSRPWTELGAYGKYGVISQTQTWSGTGSNPRTYVMSNLVTGLIPRANIDLFESAGATFNESTGYFELNGLADLSYEEMKNIYKHSVFVFRSDFRYSWYSYTIGSGLKIRTLIMPPETRTAGIAADLTWALYQSSVEVFDFSNLPISNLSQTFRAISYLKKCVGINVSQITNSTNVSNAFLSDFSLEEAKVSGLKVAISFSNSSLLSLESVVYMVENAANTSAITITIHATAYARCQADTTEYTYGGNTYTGVIALATAKNITIASA